MRDRVSLLGGASLLLEEPVPVVRREGEQHRVGGQISRGSVVEGNQALVSRNVVANRAGKVHARDLLHEEIVPASAADSTMRLTSRSASGA